MRDSSAYRLLVPLDGTSLAENALPVARRLMQSPSDELLLLRVVMLTDVDIPIGAEYNMLWPDYREASTPGQERQEAVDYLEAVRNRPVFADLNTRALVVEGDRSQAIVDTAIKQDVDAIIITTHGRTGLSRWVMGSVAERVLQSGPCPVLLIRNQGPDASNIPQRILITLDGSALSETALEPALTLAERLGSTVHLLRVFPALEQEDDKDPADPYVENLASDLIERGVPLMAKAVGTPGSGASNIAVAIMQYAADQNIDLIAMSTHGRSGLQRWVYGSVTEKVLRGTDRSLLVVRPAKLEQ